MRHSLVTLLLPSPAVADWNYLRLDAVTVTAVRLKQDVMIWTDAR